MSGNPFRKAAPPQPTISTTVEPPELKPATGGTRKASKGKRVRIQTPPPLSPDSPESFPIWPTAPEHQISSPPPPLSASNERFISPFPAPDDRLEQELEPDQSTLDNTRRNSASDAAGMYTNGGTFNPFAKTLETMESKYNQKREQKASGGAVDWSAAESTATSKKSTSKPAMDVDSFKRMLMGGKQESAPEVEKPAATTPRPPPARFGSTTITTSTSVPASATLDDEDERSDLESASSEEDDDEPPPTAAAPTPATPSGSAPPLPDRQTPARGPQVVSFSDWSSFDQELEEPAVLPASTSLDKTLPAAPRPPPPPARRPRAPTNESLTASATSALEPPKQDVPRPPRPRQSSTYSITSDAPPPSTSNISQPFMPPPVAPRRRAHSNLSTNSTASSIDAPTPTTGTDTPTPPIQQHSTARSRNDSIQSVSSMTPSLTGRSAAAVPPPPPARRAAPKPPVPSSAFPLLPQEQAEHSSTEQIHRGSVTRNPSSSRSSPSAPRQHGFMPPPPPPRRRGSSKGSLDLPDSRRGSAVDRPRGSTDSGRPSLSIAREEEEEPMSERKEEKDLFADLDALQREVDALRKQIR